jgi:hypothetical protein
MGLAVQVEALWNGLRDNSGNPLSGGKVYAYSAGTTTDKALYTAVDKSASATQPLILDAYGKAQVWADGAYKFVVKDSNDNTLQTLDNLRYGYDDGVLIWGSTSGGTGNAQTISVSSSITSYSNGQRFIFIAGNSNTGAATLNINSIGALSIVKGSTPSALASGDIRSGQIVDVVYESGGGGRFRLQPYFAVQDIQNSLMHYVAGAGTANAQTITLSPAVLALVAGQTFRFLPSVSNTGALTLNVNGLGATAVQYKGKACVGGEVVQNVPAEVTYDGTQFQLANHGGGWADFSASATYSAATTMTFTGVTTNTWKYQRHGKRVDIIVNATGTLGGTATTAVLVDLPIAASSVNGGSFPVFISNNGTVGGTAVFNTTTQLSIRRYDAAAFTAAPTACTIALIGSYETA